MGEWRLVGRWLELVKIHLQLFYWWNYLNGHKNPIFPVFVKEVKVTSDRAQDTDSMFFPNDIIENS